MTEKIVKKLFKTEDNIPYAIVTMNEKEQVIPVFSQEMEHHIVQYYRTTENRIPKKNEREEIKTSLAAEAIYECETLPVWLRIAKTNEGIELNLNNENSECVKITKNGWEVTKPSSYFYNPETSKSLPKPIKGGSFELFKKHFKIKTDDDLMLIVGFMISCLCPNAKSYPVLVLQGEQGSAKSTTTEMIKMLVDPAKGIRRGLNKKEQDMFIVAKHNHLVSFDNVSLVKGNISDTLCLLTTGGAFSCRALWTNDGENLIELCKPIILNGITDFITRADLSNRSITIELAPISKSERKSEEEVMRSFQNDLPLMLGVLMDGLSSALKNKELIRLNEKPRMADVALWCTQAEEGLQWPKYSFVKAFNANQQKAILTHLSHEVLAIAIRRFLTDLNEKSWEGTATDLLKTLEKYKPYMESSKSWPSTPSYLSQNLSRLSPNLREIGIDTDRERVSEQRTIMLKKLDSFKDFHSKNSGENQEYKNRHSFLFDNDRHDVNDAIFD